MYAHLTACNILEKINLFIQNVNRRSGLMPTTAAFSSLFKFGGAETSIKYSYQIYGSSEDKMREELNELVRELIFEIEFMDTEDSYSFKLGRDFEFTFNPLNYTYSFEFVDEYFQDKIIKSIKLDDIRFDIASYRQFLKRNTPRHYSGGFSSENYNKGE